MKRFLQKLCFALLLVTVAGIAFAQSDTQGAKQDMKDAGHDTKNAAKSTGHAVKKTSKKAAHKTAKKTKQGAQKVEDKTAPPQ
jgi:Ni/Co efflux regulator RcnB